MCEPWNARDLGDEFLAPVKSNVPVLFVSGTLDARTPIATAEEYRGGFPNSQHLILDGAVLQIIPRRRSSSAIRSRLSAWASQTAPAHA